MAQNTNEPTKPVNLSLSAIKVVALLESFSLAQPELKASELAEKVGMPTSSVYRYLAALVNKGFIDVVPGTGQYTLGLKTIELAGVALSRLEVRRHGQGEIDRLADALQMNANLGVLYEGDILHLAFAVRTEISRLHAVVGRRTAAHCTAMGKSIYAHTPWDDVAETIGRFGWRPLTDHSITDLDRLRDELIQVKERGYAVDRGEASIRTYCVGAPVFGRNGEVVAAISVSTTPDRFEEVGEAEVAAQVMRFADHLSSRLGYGGIAHGS